MLQNMGFFCDFTIYHLDEGLFLLLSMILLLTLQSVWSLIILGGGDAVNTTDPGRGSLV